MTLTQSLIARYRRLRVLRTLRPTCDGAYAFIGYGSHATANLYPVLDYLHVPLKYVCVRTAAKARLLARRLPNVCVTTDVADILRDESVRGVFVCVGPDAHFALAAAVLRSGKSLFVEKPPCRSADELARLIALQREHNVPLAVAGLQQRCAPATRILRHRLRGARSVSYNLRCLTGAYPEGDALPDLFIHPLDYVTHLFGPARVSGCECVGSHTLLLLLRHGEAKGVVELSTGYSWTTAAEWLSVRTSRGVYELHHPESLVFRPLQGTCCGVPIEKVMRHADTAVTLYGRNGFIPTQAENSLHAQGYFDLLRGFVDTVEGRTPAPLPTLASLTDTYALLADVSRAAAEASARQA